MMKDSRQAQLLSFVSRQEESWETRKKLGHMWGMIRKRAGEGH